MIGVLQRRRPARTAAVRSGACAAVGLAVVAVLAVSQAPARADYGLDEHVWSDLGYLLVTAREAKVELEPVDVLDLGRLRPGDVVLWLYPQRRMPVDPLLSFVRDGGYLVLADDLGHGDELLAAAGISRSSEPSGHTQWYQSQEGLPVWRPAIDHFLFFNVDEVTGNHAASLKGAGDPILTWGETGSAVVIERRLGDGALLAIADPSIFLNEMLRRFYGNKQFAANAMRLYCDRDLCPVKLVLPDATIAGSYRAGVGRLGRLPALFDDAAKLINAQLGQIADSLQTAPRIHLLIGALFAWALASLASLLWARRGRRRAPPLGLSLQGVSPVALETVGLARAHREADFAEPVRVLLVEARRLEQAPALLALQAVTGRGAPAPSAEGSGASAAARQALLRIRSEAESLRGPEPAVVSADRFQRLLADVRTLWRYVDGPR